MPTETNNGNWTKVIRPRKGLLDLGLGSLWRYRDLWYMYIRRDIVTFYKQTVLGPLWFIIQPVLTTVMYMFVFGGLAGISTDGAPQPLFYLSGIMLWNYFSDSFNVSSTLPRTNSLICPLITSSLSCTIFSDMVYSSPFAECCVVTPFYQSL